MNPVDRPLLDIGLTRLEFLRISGKGLAGLTIAPALLSLLGCKQEDIDSGTVGLINTPKGVLVTQRARCTGCHRCEISCTNFNDGSVGTFFSRISLATTGLALAAACMAISTIPRTPAVNAKSRNA